MRDTVRNYSSDTFSWSSPIVFFVRGLPYSSNRHVTPVSVRGRKGLTCSIRAPPCPRFDTLRQSVSNRAQLFLAVYSYRSKLRGPFMAACRAQTSLQPPLALPDTSSHCLLGFLLLFLKYTIAEMKATSKLRSPHPSAERPLQGVRGRFLFLNCPHANITSSNVPYLYFSSFTLF